MKKNQRFTLATNSLSEDAAKKISHYITVAKNALVDMGDGVIEFKNSLEITNDQEQRNGTRYEIKSMDLSEYNNQLTANHENNIESVIGQVFGTRKVANKRVVIDGIRFAIKENALARFAYDMLVGGFLTDFSIETFGPWPDQEGVYKESKLTGLSLVVVGNNRGARVNSPEFDQLAHNSMEQAKKDGLDTSLVEKNLLCYDNSNSQSNKETNMKYKLIKNGRNFAIVVNFKDDSGADVSVSVAPGQSVQVLAEQAAAVEKQMNDATEPEKPAKPAEGTSAEALKAVVEAAVKPLAEKLAQVEKNAFDKAASEPGFRKDASGKSEVAKMNWKERHGQQILQAWNFLKAGDRDAQAKLAEINKIHLEALQEKGLVANTITIADMGNFVISPELLSEIEGFRSDFSALISRLDYRETLSLQMAWLKRSGDINMQEVEMCDDGSDGNLKPISEYGASIETSNLHELAAVTPVCNAATRFLAADLLGDVARGYRTDYDRKRAQLFIARLQQAVNATGNAVTYATTSDTNALKSLIETWAAATEEIMNGTFIFSNRTYGELVKRIVGAGISGPLAGVFTTGDQPLFLGRPYIVVPNELMPALNTAETRVFTVEGVNVTINKGAFYTDLSQFSGRTSGGLQYDLSTEAAYEEGETVKSAFQRNELVLRGSFFRGGAIRDEDRVWALNAPGVS